MSAQPRIRLALIGLSASAKTSWASNAHLPYLLSPRGQAKYEIVALLNSSVAAAQAAIETYELPAATRAYGDPAALAADADVDLVVCNTRVDKHYETVVESVRRGKAVYVEWPLAQDANHAWELAGIAREKGGRSVVGLQGAVAPIVKRLRELLGAEGRIGKVLSSEVRAFGGLSDRELVPERLAYFTQREVGGNVFTIGFAHLFDLFQAALGELASVKGDVHLQRPEVRLQGADGNFKAVQSNVPDLISVSGKWDESNITQKNATLHYRYRRGQPFPGEPALEWTINGEKGEIRIIFPNSTFIQVGDPAAPRVIEVHDFETNKVEKVEWDWEAWQQDLPIPARSIGSLYEAFADAKGEKVGDRYRTMADAAKRHQQLEEILGGWQP